MREPDHQVSDAMGDVATDQSAPSSRPNKASRTIISLIRVTLFGYATILVTLVVMETRIVYPAAYMNDRTTAPDHAANVSIVDVQYVTSDDVSLTGRLLDRKDSSNTVLFFHGNGVKAAWMDDWTRQLSYEFDATVMVAEYRGYESSSKHTPNEEGVIIDCLAARDFLCRHQGLQPEDIVLYGRSLGGGCAVAVAADGGAKALVLDRTFERMVDVAADRFPFVPIHWLMRNQYDSVARIARYDGPLIQLHGTADKVIPIVHGKNLHDAATCRHKHWIEIPAFGHNDRLSASYLREMAAKVGEFTASDD